MNELNGLTVLSRNLATTMPRYLCCKILETRRDGRDADEGEYGIWV
jgi:hypothetical protein